MPAEKESPNPPSEPLYARESAEPPALGPSRGPGVPSGPQTGAQSLEEPAEPDNPAAYALARHIADYPVSTLQAAFRYLNAPLTMELHDGPDVPTVPNPEHAALKRAHIALAEQAGKDQAAIARVHAECERIEAAVRANPQGPDFDGAYLAALRHIRVALEQPQDPS
ncbi:hypothetical protein ABT010_13295 [Streptomyces sp. NPDC002668]|uniref:hypothetical protein n=1 Tax=Streptomyces sp. NPDC002668 TaxID=3154422 RepID=UPI003320E062